MGRLDRDPPFAAMSSPVDPDRSIDDILITLREIIVAGVTLTEILNSRLPSPDACGQALFALRTIQAAGRRGLSQADIARALGLSAPATTRLIDHLQRDGLAVRNAHPSDRRVNVITLSDQGTAVLTDVANLLAQRQDAFPRIAKSSDDSFTYQLSKIVRSTDSILKFRP